MIATNIITKIQRMNTDKWLMIREGAASGCTNIIYWDFWYLWITGKSNKNLLETKDTKEIKIDRVTIALCNDIFYHLSVRYHCDRWNFRYIRINCGEWGCNMPLQESWHNFRTIRNFYTLHVAESFHYFKSDCTQSSILASIYMTVDS